MGSHFLLQGIFPTRTSCSFYTGRQILYHCATWEAKGPRVTPKWQQDGGTPLWQGLCILRGFQEPATPLILSSPPSPPKMTSFLSFTVPFFFFFDSHHFLFLRLTETRNSYLSDDVNIIFFSFIVCFLQVALFYVSVLISMFDSGDFFQMLSDPRLPLHSSVLRTEEETGSPMGAACAG